MKTYIISLAVLLLVRISYCQNNSGILLSIDDHEITANEFLRIYNKNSSITTEEQKNIEDYLDLFINYKLKVIEAENLGYDTMSSFINEIGGYNEQLIKPYLENNEIIDSLVEIAYKRQLKEMNVGHILYKLPKNPSPKDTATAYNALLPLRERLLKGDAIEMITGSDPESPVSGDELGWFSVFRMVYPFEDKVYNSEVGEVSMPFRSKFGYHIIRVNNSRTNRGSVRASHIFTMTPSNPSDLEVEAAKSKIEKAYKELENGTEWKEVVEKYSEHPSSARRGGSIGVIKSDSKPVNLTDACFLLDTGKYSEILQTEYGFHIVKADEFIPISPFEELEETFRQKLQGMENVQHIEKEKLINGFKKEYGFRFFDENMAVLLQLADSSMYMGSWNPDVASNRNESVFSIGNENYSVYDIAKHIGATRISAKSIPLETGIKNNTDEFMNEKIEEFGRKQLPLKYPELGNLMEEYHDGILLFNLTEDKVWEKAVEDSSGLEQFFENLTEKHRWEPRIAITKYSFTDSTLIPSILKNANKRSRKGLAENELAKIICPGDSLPCVKFREFKYEKGDNSIADSLAWVKGTNIVSKDKDGIILYYVDKIIPASEKGLEDARGLYTADYQSYLEKEWIKALRSKYRIEIHEEVLAEVNAKEKKTSN